MPKISDKPSSPHFGPSASSMPFLEKKLKDSMQYPRYQVNQSVQSLSRVRLLATPWTAAHQASLSLTNSQSLPKFMSFESVMPSNHLIHCRPLLPLPSNLSQHQGLFKWVSSPHQVAIPHLRTTKMCSWKIPVKQDWNQPAIIQP